MQKQEAYVRRIDDEDLDDDDDDDDGNLIQHSRRNGETSSNPSKVCHCFILNNVYVYVSIHIYLYTHIIMWRFF